MVSKPLILAAVLVLFGAFMVLPQPVSAASGVQSQLAQQCVFVVAGGPIVHDNLTITSQSTPQNVTLSIVGTTEGTFDSENAKMSITPTSGQTPIVVDITFQANSTASAGGTQVGVVGAYGLQLQATLFTVRVVTSTASESSGCNTIGLPLPESTVVVTMTSLGLGLLTQSVTRQFVDLDKERRMKAEVNAFNKEKKDAALAKDKVKQEKLKKKELAIRQAQSKVQLARTKVTFITIVPLFLVYYLMATFLGGYGAIVAFSPVPIPFLVGASSEMALFWWYILGSFTLSSILSRVMHTTT